MRDIKDRKCMSDKLHHKLDVFVEGCLNLRYKRRCAVSEAVQQSNSDGTRGASECDRETPAVGLHRHCDAAFEVGGVT
jgi:hypothetical protein